MDAHWIRCIFNENARQEYGWDAAHHLSVPARGWNPLTSPVCKGYTGWTDGDNMYNQCTDRGDPFRYGLHRVLQITDERFAPCRVEDTETGETFDAVVDRERSLFLRCRNEKHRSGLDPVMDGTQTADGIRYILHWNE